MADASEEVTVRFSMNATERRAFGDLFWGLGVTAVVLAIAAGVFVGVNGCRRMQALRCGPARHISIIWWGELGLRAAVGTACIVFLAW